jgi:hypothetical protein
MCPWKCCAGACTSASYMCKRLVFADPTKCRTSPAASLGATFTTGAGCTLPAQNNAVCARERARYLSLAAPQPRPARTAYGRRPPPAQVTQCLQTAVDQTIMSEPARYCRPPAPLQHPALQGSCNCKVVFAHAASQSTLSWQQGYGPTMQG